MQKQKLGWQRQAQHSHSAVLHPHENMAAAVGSHLSNGRVNVGLLRECARRELLQCLNKQPGSKVTRKFLYLHVICKLQYFKYRFIYGVLECGKPEKMQTSFVFCPFHGKGKLKIRTPLTWDFFSKLILKTLMVKFILAQLEAPVGRLQKNMY